MYSYDEDKLVLVTDGEPNLDIDDEVTLAHEYVHCFQYDAFDFKRLGKLEEKEDKNKANTEYSTAIEALMEGDATISSISYAGAKLGEQGFTDWINSAKEASSGDKEDSYPPFLERSFSFPYDQGADFALYLWQKGGWEELNKAYDNPPSTTEQVLHPEKYLAGEEAEDLKLPDLSDDLGKGWEQLDDDVFGEFDVYNYLLTILGDEGTCQRRRCRLGWRPHHPLLRQGLYRSRAGAHRPDVGHPRRRSPVLRSVPGFAPPGPWSGCRSRIAAWRGQAVGLGRRRRAHLHGAGQEGLHACRRHRPRGPGRGGRGHEPPFAGLDADASLTPASCASSLRLPSARLL